MKEFSSNHPWCLFRRTSKSHLGEKGRTIIFKKCWLLVGYVAFRPTILSLARRPTLLVVAKSPPCGGTRRFRRFRFFLFEVSKPIGMVNALNHWDVRLLDFFHQLYQIRTANEAALIHCRLLGASTATWPGWWVHWNLVSPCWCVLRGINIHGAVQRTYEAKLWIQKRLGRQSYPYHPCMVYLPRFAMKCMVNVGKYASPMEGISYDLYIYIVFSCFIICNGKYAAYSWHVKRLFFVKDPILSGCMMVRNRCRIISWKARSVNGKKYDL